jgi:hypothetical protein
LLAIFYENSLLSFKEWGDESETIITSVLLKNSYSLYDQIAESHGPLIFFPGIFIAHLSGYKILGYRIFIAILQLLAILSIYTSPVLIKFNDRIRTFYFIFALSVVLLYYPKFYSHTFLYHNLAGIFLVFILTRYTFPSIANYKLDTRNVIIGNSLIASMPFLGISFIPISFFLFFSSIKKEYFYMAIVTSFIAVILNILFLLFVGSFKGFYVYHIYINTHLAPLFFPSDFYPSSFLGYINNIFHATQKNFSGIVTFAWISLGLLNIAYKERYFAWKYLVNWRCIFVILGLFTLLARGSSNHALPYYYACLTFFSTVKINQFKFYKIGNLIIYCLIFFIILKMSFFFVDDRIKFKQHEISYDTDFSKLVKSYTNSDDKIIAYSWQNFEYLASERLPISGSASYFPVTVAYNKNPILGINIDGCKDIEMYKPKIMLIDKLDFASNYLWSSFGQCIDFQLSRNYIKIVGKPFYIRKDVARKYFDQLDLEIK